MSRSLSIRRLPEPPPRPTPRELLDQLLRDAGERARADLERRVVEATRAYLDATRREPLPGIVAAGRMLDAMKRESCRRFN